MKIPAFVWIIGFFVIGGGLLIFLNSNKNKVNSDLKGTLPVQIEVYSDYNCPHCADFSPFVDEVASTFADKVNITLKHAAFLAPSSSSYAYAAEAAREQGKFNEFNHALYAWVSFTRDSANTNFSYTEDEKTFYSQAVDVTKLAERLGLDLAKFDTDRKSSTIVNRVLDQKAELEDRMGSVSTPAVFIYGEQFSLSTYNDLKTKVQELITQAESNNNETK